MARQKQLSFRDKRNPINGRCEGVKYADIAKEGLSKSTIATSLKKGLLVEDAHCSNATNP